MTMAATTRGTITMGTTTRAMTTRTAIPVIVATSEAVRRGTEIAAAMIGAGAAASLLTSG
jgi:hypothetical protein